MERRPTRRLPIGTCLFWIYLGTVWITGILGDEGPTSSCNSTGLDYITHEKRLISCLLKDYDSAVRPALSPDEPVNVTLSSVIMTITDLNEKTRVLTTESWMKQIWIDVQLRWNPEDFGGLKEIRLPVEKLWTPEIVLFNNADESFRYVMDKLVVVNSKGHVAWVPHARLRSFCDLDLTLFPYDTQTCKMFLGSWTYDESMVALDIPKNVNDRRFLPKTAEWEVLDFDGGVLRFSDGFKNYPTVVYILKMKRISIYYKCMLVAPTILLALLTLLLFWIPADSNERFMLATGILVSLTVLLLLLEGYLPTELGKLPIIASFLGFNFVLLVMTIAVSIVTFNCQYRGVKSGMVPSWMRWVFLGRLSRLMCVGVRPYTSSLPVDVVTEESDARRELQGLQLSDPLLRSADGSSDHIKAIEKTMDDIRVYLRYLAAKSEISGQVAPHSELIVNEWHQVALVVDRLVFCVFLFISVVTSIAIFSQS